jgi:hypothetical protein
MTRHHPTETSLPAAPPPAPRPSPPTSSTMSPRALALAHAGRDGLERAMLRGEPPALADLVGWEFRGLNTGVHARPLGIRKFIKGFYRRDGEGFGYNLPAVQNRVPEPWRAKPNDASPRRFGFYRVAPVDPTARDNAYLNAVLLDYGRGGNQLVDPMRTLRDYVVQVAPGDPDLLLGKAYVALGPARIPVGYFVLERHRPAPVEL